MRTRVKSVEGVRAPKWDAQIVTRNSMVLISFVSLFIAAVVPIERAIPATSPISDRDHQPSITWQPSSVALVVPPGATRSMKVSLKSQKKAEHATVEARPEIAKFLSIQPKAFPEVPAGKPQQVQLSFSVPSGTIVGTYTGTVEIRKAKETLSQTLKVSLHVIAGGVSLNVPAGFEVHSELIALGGPISLDNFGHQFGHGGIVPASGAEIVITSVTVPSQSLPDFIASEHPAQGISITSTSRITVSGSAATEVFSTDTLTFHRPFKQVAVYAPHNDLLFKFYLDYWGRDPLENRFLASFRQLLSSVQFWP